MARIKKIKIEASKFYQDPFEVDFSKKLNCIMGGRGSGKTTLLSVLVSAVIPEAEEDEEMFSALHSNLGSGKVYLTIEDFDGDEFEIEKVLNENPVVYDSERNLINFDDVMEKFSIDYFRATEIEEIGSDPVLRLALIDKHLTKKIKDIRKGESAILTQLSSNKAILSDLITQKKDLELKLEPLGEVESLLKDLEKNKPSGSEEDSKNFTVESEAQKNREFETQFKDEVQRDIDDFYHQLENLIDDVSASIQRLDKFKPELNKDSIEKIKAVARPAMEKLKQDLVKKTEDIKKSNVDLLKSSNELVLQHKEQEAKFSQLKTRFEKNREFFNKLSTASKKVNAKALIKKEQETVLERINSAIAQRSELLIKIKGINRKIFELRHTKVEQINSELGGDVKITLKEGGITSNYERALKDSLKGKGFNYKEESEKIAQNISPVDLSLLVLKGDSSALSERASIQKDKAVQILEALLKAQDMFRLEGVSCQDLPNFFLKIDKKVGGGSTGKDNYRQTEQLSTGQRCTAILPIIFAASTNPLIIDQPEDNLDNKYIADAIHKIIKLKKDYRQMIFVTHNPNIPVLSGAEFNLFLDYSAKKSVIDVRGTIDQVKSNILTLLEGGEEAFNLRKEIYGV